MKYFLIFIVLLGLSVSSFAADRESVYDRVIRTGVIRCGYTPYSVGLNKNLNTGELWGIYKDIIEAVGQKLDLKIQWVEEVGWGQQIEGLNSGRYDLICSPANITGARARSADMTVPLYYSPVWIWVRRDDARFDNKGRAVLNNSSVKISVMDGEQSESQARFYFPKATQIALPQASDFSSLMMNVVNKKADLAFVEPLTIFEFMEKNPNTLRRIKGDKPLLLAANVMLMKRGETEFKAMLNNVLADLFLSGGVDKAIDHYEKYSGSYLRSKGPQ